VSRLRLRLGLAGTGYWAQIAHAPALATAPDIDFTAVWGRRPEAAAVLAAEHSVTPFSDFDEFLGAVDAVAFAIPPDVQAGLAVRAARAGKHLLLEKPIAVSEAAARELVDAVDQAGVASLVFFTARYQPDVRAWLADVHRRGPWTGGIAVWLGSALTSDNPFNTPWRRDKGGLWDLGPHLVSLLWASLGPVTAVTADAGSGGATYLVLHHEGGASSSVTTTIAASPEAASSDLYLWGDAGVSRMPTAREGSTGTQDALRVAISELAELAGSESGEHECDVHFGYAIGEVLAAAQRQLAASEST
jgi:predicted dehydrogenase